MCEKAEYVVPLTLQQSSTLPLHTPLPACPGWGCSTADAVLLVSHPHLCIADRQPL